MKKNIRLIICTVMLCICCMTSAFATTPAAPKYITDNASVLSTAEVTALSQKLVGISYERDFAVVIVAVPNTDDFSAEYMAINHYENNGFNSNGIILLIATESRDYWIQPFGTGLDRFDDYAIMDIEDSIVPLLSQGNYYESFNKFADMVDNSFKFPWLKYIVIALIIGAILSLITVIRMHSKLKSVKAQTTANMYTKENSLLITSCRDFYLYRRMTRTPIPRNNGSGGRSSSSRGSRGGRGGKF